MCPCVHGDVVSCLEGFLELVRVLYDVDADHEVCGARVVRVEEVHELRGRLSHTKKERKEEEKRSIQYIKVVKTIGKNENKHVQVKAHHQKN